MAGIFLPNIFPPNIFLPQKSWLLKRWLRCAHLGIPVLSLRAGRCSRTSLSGCVAVAKIQNRQARMYCVLAFGHGLNTLIAANGFVMPTQCSGP